MQPNPLVISLTDDCLFRYGRIDATLAALSPQYTHWRALWRDIAADPDRYRERMRHALTKRDGEG
jgi:hypothetical protein